MIVRRQTEMANGNIVCVTLATAVW